MDVKRLSGTYEVRKANESDVDALFELMRKNDMFYKYHPPLVTKESIRADMKALPPRKNAEDKYYIGFFDGSALIASMDLILAYPTEEIAFIGFFMTDVRVQKRGIGSKIIGEVCTYLKALGYKKVRLGADRGNPQSRTFWLKNRFCEIGGEKYMLMERRLQDEEL